MELVINVTEDEDEGNLRDIVCISPTVGDVQRKLFFN